MGKTKAERAREEAKTWRGASGQRRRLTGLQEKIINYRLDHPGVTLTEITKVLGCSYTAVLKTMRNPLCQKREAEIRELVDKAKVASLQERQEKLTEIIRAKITDYMDGDGKFRITEESPNQAAIAEYGVIETKRGKQQRLKLHSVIEAIEALDREEGIGRQTILADQRSINITHVTVVEHPQVREEVKFRQVLMTGEDEVESGSDYNKEARNGATDSSEKNDHVFKR